MESQSELSQALDRYLRERGYKISNVEAGKVTRQQQTQTMNILIVFLLTMAVLTAVVGSIGLMGTMGMNVLERTREIGVMRAIGAVDGEIVKSVVVEGVMIGLISYAAAVAALLPHQLRPAAHHQYGDAGHDHAPGDHPGGLCYLVGRRDLALRCGQYVAGAQRGAADDSRSIGL